MDFGKTFQTGKEYTAIQIGDQLKEERKVNLRDMFAYLGAADDHNPLYLKEGYAAQTHFQKVIVPSGLLVSWLNTLVSMKMPGPGSVIKELRLSFPGVLHLEEAATFSLEVIEKRDENKIVTIQVSVGHGDKQIVEGEIDVIPPSPLKLLIDNIYDNF